MFTVRVDISGLKSHLKNAEDQVRAAAASALKSESYRVQQVMKSYAQGAKDETAPLSNALRKGRLQILPFLSRVMSYDVDQANLSSQIGILEKGKKPVNPRMAILAKQSAKGYRIPVNRKAQRGVAAKLEKKYKVISERRQWGSVGGLSSFIPRIGTHTVKERPIVSKVYAAERDRIVQNVRQKFAAKFNGKRF